MIDVTAVFDCMIFLQSASRRSPSFACLRLVEEGYVRLIVCNSMLNEIRDVAKRPALRARLLGITDEWTEKLLGWIRNHADEIPNPPDSSDLLDDQKDAIYLNAALEARADYLVSRDRDLLSLGVLDRVEGGSLEVVDPPSFLRILRADIARDLGYE